MYISAGRQICKARTFLVGASAKLGSLSVAVIAGLGPSILQWTRNPNRLTRGLQAAGGSDGRQRSFQPSALATNRDVKAKEGRAPFTVLFWPQIERKAAPPLGFGHKTDREVKVKEGRGPFTLAASRKVKVKEGRSPFALLLWPQTERKAALGFTPLFWLQIGRFLHNNGGSDNNSNNINNNGHNDDDHDHDNDNDNNDDNNHRDMKMKIEMALAVLSLVLAADPGSYVRMESMRGESMAGMLLSSDGLAEMERQMSGEVNEMQQSAASAIKQRAEKLEDFVRDTKQRYVTAREAVSTSLAGLADSVATRWRRLTVASFHERLGKCCCSASLVDGCEWQPFKLGGPIVDYECKIGFMDYMDAITAQTMEGGRGFTDPAVNQDPPMLSPCDVAGASSNTSEVDNILDQCAASKGWQYQSWEWSPPAGNISIPAETSVVVPDVVKPTDNLIVAVPVDNSESHQPAKKEVSGGAPREALQPNETALDLDVETVSSGIKDIVGLPDLQPADQAPKVAESQEKQAEGMDELDRAAAELAAAERAVSLLPSSGQTAPADASAQQLVQSDPAAAVEVNTSVVPNVVPGGWTKAQQGPQDSDRGAGKSSLQKRQIMRASGDAGHALEDEHRRRPALVAGACAALTPTGSWAFVATGPAVEAGRHLRARPLASASTVPTSRCSACRNVQDGSKTTHREVGAETASGAFSIKGSALGAAAILGVRRVLGHRCRQPVQRAQSPFAEIAFAAALYGTVRAAAHAWVSATDSFALRDELFQDMAVAHTYKNSIRPWIQSGVIALISSIFVVFAVKEFIKSMKEWEQQQEVKEMSAMGEDALFLMSTPVDATPLEKKKDRMRKRLTPLPMRLLGGLLDKVWLLRVGACVGYLLPFLNALDFGEISISLYPYAVGVPPCEPIVNFMQHTLKMRYLYNAYLKSGYYFLIVWFLFIQLAVRNKAAPFYVRFHSSQAILISMLLGVPQQVFFAVLNPWESGLWVQTFMYHSMVSIFLFIVCLLLWCCLNALMKRQMAMPLVSEAAVMWAGKE
ncbi:Protein TIC 20-v, chloroplastic [Symbiodinium microadriaticum]|uniref:Protein TIC 20-v, chloroplastic n=1 Tax=Symbiodinium microadriaticum TaxID=2951 RepID=A0A1Q9EQE0_SYMMI|nr:Protein TIC 20-v, chloroplastic [Symbiodinium microadriaticum]